MVKIITQPQLNYIIGKMYYHKNISNKYLINELIQIDILNNFAILRHPETKFEFGTQLSMLKITNRINNKPYYNENKL